MNRLIDNRTNPTFVPPLMPIFRNHCRDQIMDYISQEIGEKIRKLPQVVINGDRIGGYYDLMELLINKK